MNPKSPREMEDERLLAERAAEWVDVLKTAGAPEREEFADWLAESPRHVEEFLLVTALDRAIDELPLGRNARIQAMLACNPSSVVPLRLETGSAAGRRAAPALKRAGLASLRARAAGFAALAIAASLFVWQLASRGDLYSTGVGEQRTVLLPDGSEMALTAGTEARVRFSGSGRDVELLKGEALFSVAKDAVRPFVVLSSGTMIQAIGTQFNVVRRPSGTIVSVLEGAVRIDGRGVKAARPADAPATTLHAGDEVRVAKNGDINKRDRVSDLTVTTWRQHRLVFHADTLLDIAAEFNRYNRVPRLLVEGEAAEIPRYTGVFDADDPRSLLAFLREDPQISIEESGDALVIRPRKPAE